MNKFNGYTRFDYYGLPEQRLSIVEPKCPICGIHRVKKVHQKCSKILQEKYKNV